MTTSYYFTVFIPAYNRAHTLPRLFESLERQTFKDFEVLLVDDGSSDDTRAVVEMYKERSEIDIKYFYQENRGKPAARNLGVAHAKGILFKTVDSDDVLTDDCLELMKMYWESIEDDRKTEYAGIIGLCADYHSKKVIGDRFPKDIFDSNHVLNNTIYGIRGDKTQCIRTDLMKKHPFPIIDGEKFIAEGIVWNRIGLTHKFRYVNQIMKYTEYLEGGLSSNSIGIRVENCKSSVLYYSEYVNIILENHRIPIRYKLRGYVNYVRFSQHCGINFKQQLKAITRRTYYLLAYPMGRLLHLTDLIKLNAKKTRSK